MAISALLPKAYEEVGAGAVVVLSQRSDLLVLALAPRGRVGQNAEFEAKAGAFVSTTNVCEAFHVD